MTCDSESVGACQLSSLNGSTLSPISLPVRALGRVRVWSIEGSVCCLQSTLPTLGARGQAILFEPDGVPMVSLPEVQAHPIPFADRVCVCILVGIGVIFQIIVDLKSEVGTCCSYPGSEV